VPSLERVDLRRNFLSAIARASQLRVAREAKNRF
jgi:hypothetical protein